MISLLIPDEIDLVSMPLCSRYPADTPIGQADS
jgi:hypothetical protein